MFFFTNILDLFLTYFPDFKLNVIVLAVLNRLTAHLAVRLLSISYFLTDRDINFETKERFWGIHL